VARGTPASTMPSVSVSVVVVTYNSMQFLERSLASVEGYETIVVDHGSTDGTVDFVRERFPAARLIEQENLGFGAGNNTGMRTASGDYFLLLNADAWVLADAVERLVEFAEQHQEAAVVGPKLLNPDGTLQRSVRGYPTVWRIATEYLFLRKLAPRSRFFNAFYGAGFDHESVREAEFLGGACLLVRREAVDSVGGFDEDFFLMSEEVDWCFRFRQAGWKVLFYPGAEVVHVLGSSANPAMFRDLVRGHLRFLWKHQGPREAERARKLMLVALLLRGLMFRGDRGRAYRDTARWLRSDRVPALLESAQ
jgi:N-acetylglucosaminyl-diphospho-decaprenol L-rhamnosyltransferase